MSKILSFLIILIPFVAFGQQEKNKIEGNAVINNITSKLYAYSEDHSTEKAYLQFDKPYYAASDTIYFKAYITTGAQHKLSGLSGILYIELINPENVVGQSIILPVTAGVTWGDLALADTLKGGEYRVRAYTNWMRNEGDSSFFEKSIQIGPFTHDKKSGNDISDKVKKDLKAAKSKIDVQFLPEGGSLIAGNYSKVAFKAIGPEGLGTDIKGTITDDAGAEVCTFESTHLGMGEFNIVPEAGKIYKANISYADGKIATIELPKAVNTGYTINLNNADPDSIKVRVTGSSGSPIDKLSLIAQSGGTVYYAAENQSGNKFFTAAIPKRKFPTGIVQFTLFSQTGEPLNERLAFINNNDRLKLDLQAKENYKPRQKVKLEIVAKDKNNSPVTGSFSVSITDETKVPVNEVSECSILPAILLTPDLKGTIEEPNYYFTNINEKTNADLDLLMLTQGYRRFEWKQVLNNDPSSISYQPEKALEISGTVKTNGGKSVAGAKVTLFTKSGGPFLIDTLTGINGKFIFKNLAFGDSTKFVVQAKVAKGQDHIVLEMDTTTALPVVNTKTTKVESFLSDTSAYLLNQRRFYEEQQKYGINKHTIVLKEVKIKGERELPIPHSENLNGSGNADQVLTSKDLEKMTCGRLIDCLQGILLHVSFKKSNGSFSTYSMGNKALVIDGTFVDSEMINYLHAEDIEGIEVINGPHYGAIYGAKMYYGGLIITTKRAHKSEYQRYAPGVITYIPKGYYKAREFYSPQYDNPKTNQKIPDLRSTIYWQPNIITDKDGKASFEYFNADSKGTYRVVLEGIDADGNLGRQVFKYKVE